MELLSLKALVAGGLVAGFAGLANAAAAHGDPLIPPTPAEIAYLDHLHKVFPGTGDPAAFHSDGWLLEKGRYACRQRDLNLVGYEATGLSPIVTQVAFIHLCPN